MKKLTSLLVLLFLIVLPFSLASAQLDDDETLFTFNDGTEFEIPEDWEVLNDTDDWGLTISDGTTQIYFIQYFPDELEGLNVSEAAELVEPQVLFLYENHDFDEDAIEGVEIGDLEGVRYEFVNENEDGDEYQEVMYFAITADDYGWVIGIAPVSDEEIEDEDAATEIAFVVFGEGGGRDRGGSGDDGDSADLTEFEFNDGSVLEIPEDWTAFSTNEDFFIELQSEELGLFFFQYFPETLDDANIGDALEMLEDYYNGYDFAEDEPFDEDNADEIEFGGVEALEYAFDNQNTDGSQYETILISMILDNDYGMIIGVYPLFGDELDNEDDALDIAAAFIEDNQ